MRLKNLMFPTTPTTDRDFLQRSRPFLGTRTPPPPAIASSDPDTIRGGQGSFPSCGQIVNDPPYNKIGSADVRAEEPLVVVSVDHEIRVLCTTEVCLAGGPGGGNADAYGMLTGYAIARLER